MKLTAFTPQITVVFPTFTIADPSAVFMESSKTLSKLHLFVTVILQYIKTCMCILLMFNVVGLNSPSSLPSGRQFSFC